MSRTLGAITLDDGVNTLLQEVTIPSTRALSLEQMHNRFGRRARLKEDYDPLKITLKGWWADSSTKFWRDFKAAMLNQQHVPFTLGDGTQFEWVDCIDLQATPVASSGAGTSTPNQRWAYTATLASYEPFVRETSPTLQNLGTQTTSNGTSQTISTYSYPGSMFAEPTWQFTFTIQSGKVVTAVQLQNTTTGESCTYTGTIPTGTWYLLMDASGGVGGNNRTTPNNDQYGLLAEPSLGRGMTLQQLSGNPADVDFTGVIPTIRQNTNTISIPPASQTNTIIATITATATLTGCNLSFVAPSRWYR